MAETRGYILDKWRHKTDIILHIIDFIHDFL